MPSRRASHHVFLAGVTRKSARFPRKAGGEQRGGWPMDFRGYIKLGSPDLEGLPSQIGNDISCVTVGVAAL